MNKTVKTWLLVSCLIVPCIGQAKVFLCKDASGRTISSDRPIPECADRAVRELGANGVVQREIAAPLTPAERREKEAAEAKKKADAIAAEAQAKTDRAMMARFRNEADIATARDRALDSPQDQIKREKISLAIYEKDLKQADSDIAVHEKNKTKPGAALLGKKENAEEAIANSKKIIGEREEDLAQINQKFDDTLKRFREVNGTTVSTK
jgi:hypothetical protein